MFFVVLADRDTVGREGDFHGARHACNGRHQWPGEIVAYVVDLRDVLSGYDEDVPAIAGLLMERRKCDGRVIPERDDRRCQLPARDTAEHAGFRISGCHDELLLARGRERPP
jgi:hypothetical protein